MSFSCHEYQKRLKYVRDVKLGKKKAFFMQPYAKLKNEKVRKGRASGYFSTDSKRLPLIAVVRAPILTEVTASLSEIVYGQSVE